MISLDSNTVGNESVDGKNGNFFINVSPGVRTTEQLERRSSNVVLLPNTEPEIKVAYFMLGDRLFPLKFCEIQSHVVLIHILSFIPFHCAQSNPFN